MPADAHPRLELWSVDTRDAGPALRAIDQSVPLLSDAERRRAAEFADAAQADEWLAAHIALRVVLQRVLGKAVETGGRRRAKPRRDVSP